MFVHAERERDRGTDTDAEAQVGAETQEHRIVSIVIRRLVSKRCWCSLAFHLHLFLEIERKREERERGREGGQQGRESERGRVLGLKVWGGLRVRKL